MIVSLTLAIVSLSTSLTKIEAQSEEEAPSEEANAEEESNAEEEAEDEEESNAEEETGTALAEEDVEEFTGTVNQINAEFTRMIWTTTRSTAAQRDLANSIGLDSGDQIVFHYGAGRDPTSTQINHLKAVTSVPDENKGFEFFSLAEIQEHAQTVADAGFGFIAYDLEGVSPASDRADVVASFQAAKAAADAAGIDLQAVPSNAITRGQYADDIAKLVDLYHYQSQPRQDDDRQCRTMRDSVVNRVNFLEDANPELEGKISYQVTLSGNAASGKTVFQTARDCIRATSPTAVDGNSIWWNSASFDNGDYRRLLRYHENNFSAGN